MANIIRKTDQEELQKMHVSYIRKIFVKRSETRTEKLIAKIRKRVLPQESKLKKVLNKWKRFLL